MKKSVLMRSHSKLIIDIKDIRSYRENNGLSKLSYTKITDLISRHNNWDKIKTDIAHYEEEVYD